MKFRKKNRHESDVFTDSLNDILFIVLMFFLIVSTSANPNVKKVGLPNGQKDTKAKQDIMLSIDKDHNFYINAKKVESMMLDSMLSQEIKRQRHYVDTPTVVIHADTLSFYGEVFRVMRIAGKDTAKVVANVSNY